MNERSDPPRSGGDQDTELRAAARAWVAEMEPGPGTHPSSEELLAYQSRGLPEEERERIQDHLAVCAGCARMAAGLEAAMSETPPEGASPLSDAAVTGRWKNMRRRLRPGAAARLLTWFERLVKTPALPWAVATVALAAVIALTAWVAALRGTVADLDRPRLNLYLADLEPGPPSLRRSEGSPTRLTIPDGAEHLLLLLDLADLRSFSAYELVISTAEGRTVWSTGGLRRTPDGNFTVALPRSFLPPGTYHLTVSGLEGTTRIPLVEYGFELHYE